MGPYCNFCQHRCFLLRIVPDEGHILLATCSRGMEHDRQQTGGYDHTNTVNPRTGEISPVRNPTPLPA